MKLFYSATSPFVRKVLVLIAEAGIEGIETIPVMGTPVAPDSTLIERNPLGKIPALMRADGPTLYDSRVICQFLDSLSGNRFYPTGPGRWDSLTVEATADGMLEAAVLMRYETVIRPEDKRFSPWVEGQWSKVDRALDVLETRWIDHLNGPVDIGQIAIGCALGYLDFRFSSRDWRKGRARLAAWEQGFAARPSMQGTRPPE